MTAHRIAWLGRGWIIGVLACAGCSGLVSPDYWPVEVAPTEAAERSLHGVVKSTRSMSSLTYQERALLTFVANPEHIRDAIGLADKHGTRTWEVIEVFLVEPGQKVSVLAEEGHDQEALYFTYRADKKIWYRVKDFESSGRGVPAVRVR